VFCPPPPQGGGHHQHHVPPRPRGPPGPGPAGRRAEEGGCGVRRSTRRHGVHGSQQVGDTPKPFIVEKTNVNLRNKRAAVPPGPEPADTDSPVTLQVLSVRAVDPREEDGAGAGGRSAESPRAPRWAGTLLFCSN